MEHLAPCAEHITQWVREVVTVALTSRRQDISLIVVPDTPDPNKARACIALLQEIEIALLRHRHVGHLLYAGFSGDIIKQITPRSTGNDLVAIIATLLIEQSKTDS